MDEMDDVEIEDVNDDGSPFRVERAPIKNQDLTSLIITVGELVSQYGWYVLVLTGIVYLLVQYLSKRRSSQSSNSPSPHTQDAVLVEKRHQALEAARRKMQEELDAQAAIFKEKQKQQEEEKRRQKIEIWESMQQGKSYKGTKLSQTTEEASSSATDLKPKTSKRPLRDDGYSPLSGQGGGSCSWRPGRRGPSSGG
ncbi:selenoprotein S [Mugil cephalus]|uniref:selenoprotein S n=1 Tax=Mugil cephalus TaxID=48193 RepID=UPI001FB5F3D1|nr:selenoprotein S [Mugil cephalus]